MTVVQFTPKAVLEADDATDGEEDDAVDLTDARNRAHAICGALSTIDLVDIDPKEFWAVFGSESLKVSTMKWVTTALKKLNSIKEGS